MDETTKARATTPRNPPPVVRSCAHCQTEFRIWYYRSDSAMFCSLRCQGLARRDVSVERFWSKVDKVGAVPAHRPELGPCWVWTDSLDSSGYARFWLTGRKGNRVLVHRYSYELQHGAEPTGQLVLHECDNRACVNPSHLRAGSYHDNSQDAVAKGRHAHGEKTPISKLNDQAVREIRASSEGIYKIAARYSVTPTTISFVRNRKIWKHVV
jgi:hypothetical protein